MKSAMHGAAAIKVPWLAYLYYNNDVREEHSRVRELHSLSSDDLDLLLYRLLSDPPLTSDILLEAFMSRMGSGPALHEWPSRLVS